MSTEKTPSVPVAQLIKQSANDTNTMGTITLYCTWHWTKASVK